MNFNFTLPVILYVLHKFLELACLKALVQVNILANGSTRPDQCYQLQKNNGIALNEMGAPEL